MLKIRTINKFRIRSISPQMRFGENYKEKQKSCGCIIYKLKFYSGLFQFI